MYFVTIGLEVIYEQYDNEQKETKRKKNAYFIISMIIRDIFVFELTVFHNKSIFYQCF